MARKERIKYIILIIVSCLVLIVLAFYFINNYTTFGVATENYLKKYDGDFTILQDEKMNIEGLQYIFTDYKKRYIYDKKNDVEFYILYSKDLLGMQKVEYDTYYGTLLVRQFNEEFEQFFKRNHYTREYVIMHDKDNFIKRNETSTIYNTEFDVVFYLYSELLENPFIGLLEKNVKIII